MPSPYSRHILTDYGEHVIVVADYDYQIIREGIRARALELDKVAERDAAAAIEIVRCDALGAELDGEVTDERSP